MGNLGMQLLDAVEAGDEDRAAALVDQGADITFMDGGWSVLHLAIQKGLSAWVDRALGAGIDPSLPLPGNGMTPLHIICEAAEGRPLNFTVTVTRDGEQVTLTEPDEIRAAIGSHPDDEYFEKIGIARRLVEAGADIHALTKDGQSPLNHASARGITEVVELLLECGAKVDEQDRFGLTCLHYAVRKGYGAAVSRLLAAGATPDIGDEYGFTPLHEAAERGRTELVGVLLEAGADRTKGTVKAYKAVPAGTTPADFARLKNQAAAAALLE
jgi:ankyrin repeat protein